MLRVHHSFLMLLIGWFPTLCLVSCEEEVISCPSLGGIEFANDMDIYDFHSAEPWNEISGFAVSPFQVGPSGSPVVYGINDSPPDGVTGTTFAAWDSGTGDRIITFQLQEDYTSTPPIYNKDWEDMTIGTCGNGSDDICIYIADTGDNDARENDNGTSRSQPCIIYKIKEPVLDDFFPDDVVQLDIQEYVTALTIDYLDETSQYTTRDVEAVFLDHTGWGEDGSKGDLYLATKDFFEDARLYRIPADVWPIADEKLAHYSPKVVGDSYLAGSEFLSSKWTSAEMSWDGTKIILASQHSNFVFLRCPGQSVAEALVGQNACMVFDNPPAAADAKKQFESVAWLNDGGNTVLTVAEVDLGNTPKLVTATLDYSDPDANGHCPAVAYFDDGNGGLVCKVLSDAGNPTFFTKPGRWCDGYLEYFPPDPTIMPTVAPSKEPSGMPTDMQTLGPSQGPSQEPSQGPIKACIPRSEYCATDDTCCGSRDICSGGICRPSISSLSQDKTSQKLYRPIIIPGLRGR